MVSTWWGAPGNLQAPAAFCLLILLYATRACTPRRPPTPDNPPLTPISLDYPARGKHNCLPGLGRARPRSAQACSTQFGSARSALFSWSSTALRSGSLHSARPYLAGPARFLHARLDSAWLCSAVVGVLGWIAACGNLPSMGCSRQGWGRGQKR